MNNSVLSLPEAVPVSQDWGDGFRLPRPLMTMPSDPTPILLLVNDHLTVLVQRCTIEGVKRA